VPKTNKSEMPIEIRVWKYQPKGPSIEKAELDALRSRVAQGRPLSPTEVRRLFQTLDARRTGIEAGIVKEFPPISSTVYNRNAYGDAGSGKVVGHLPDGTIEVKENISGGEPVKTIWREWSTEPLKSELYMGG
jgi:hypothetical protein